MKPRRRRPWSFWSSLMGLSQKIDKIIYDLWEIEIGGGGPLLCDRCDKVARGGWARVGWERKRAEREKKSREQRTEKAHMPVWLGRSWDNEKESRDSEKRAETMRKRKSRDSERGVKWVERSSRVFWKRVYEIFFLKPFS